MKSTQEFDFQLRILNICGIGFVTCYLLAVVFDHFGWTL